MTPWWDDLQSLREGCRNLRQPLESFAYSRWLEYADGLFWSRRHHRRDYGEGLRYVVTFAWTDWAAHASVHPGRPWARLHPAFRSLKKRNRTQPKSLC